MATYGFEGMMYSLQQWGIVDVLLPFILIFTVVFAVLEKTEILGKDSENMKKYAAVIAMVMAFAVVIPHVTGVYYYGFDAVEIINRALPQVGLLLVAIVMMLLTIGLWTGKKADGSKGIGQWFTLISGALVIIIFIASMGWWNAPSWLYMILSSNALPLIIAILVFGIIIKFITSPPKTAEQKAKAEEKRHTRMMEFLGGGKDK